MSGWRDIVFDYLGTERTEPTEHTHNTSSVLFVGSVPTNEKPANDVDRAPITPPNSPRWRGFVKACEQLGLHADVVREYFTTADIANLIGPEHGVDLLTKCAATLAADVELRRQSVVRQHAVNVAALPVEV